MQQSLGNRWRWWAGLLLLGGAATLPLLLGGERREQLLALNSLYLALSVCLLALPLGTALAVLLMRTDAPGRRGALFMLAAMLFMPLYLQTAAWDAGFGRQGWYSSVFGSLAAPPLEAWRGAVWVHAVAAIPWTALIVAVGLRRVNPALEEAALLDATPAQVFWSITLPQVLDSLGVAALWVFIATTAEITVADMYQVNTYARELYIGFALGEYVIGAWKASAGDGAPFGVWPGVAVTAWLAVAAVIFFAGLTRWERPASIRAWMDGGGRLFRLERGRVLGGVAVIAAIVLIAGVPVANLLYQAGIDVEQVGDERIRTWSAAKLFTLLAQSPFRFGREMGWTLAIGGVAASLAVGLGAPLAWLARRGGWRAVPALAVAAAGVAIPGPLIGLGLIAVLNREDAPWLVWLYDRTIFAPVAAILVRTTPWAILFCWFAFRSLPRAMLESAELDGAGPIARFLRLAVPLRWPALALAWLVSLAVATGDLAASILVVPPGVDTLAVRIFGLIHAGVDDQVAAICLTTIASVVALAAGGWFLLRVNRGSPPGA